MRDNSVLRKLLGLCVSTVVVVGRELRDGGDGGRSNLVVWVRRRVGVRGRCGRCGGVAPWFDNGGGERRWRHIDMGMATCELIAEAPRVSCPEHGVTVAEVAFARHDSAFSRAFEDLVVFDAIVSNKLAAARRHGISWRAVDHMCIRVATEALGRIDLLEGLVAIAVDEVKYKKGHKYLTVVCDHLTGRVIWAAKGRNKETVRAFFDALGEERAAQLQFVTCDGAEWIRTVITERAQQAIVCLDTFHLIGWAAAALDEVRRELVPLLPTHLPSPAALHEAFLWSEIRTVTKTATISLHGNTFEVDAALVGSRVEVVFDPFDLESVEIRFQGRSMGQGIPVTIGRHSHPQARPEAAPAPAPTGIDYLGLLADRREAELAELSGSINYAQLTLPDAEMQVGAAHDNTPTDTDNTDNTDNKEIQL